MSDALKEVGAQLVQVINGALGEIPVPDSPPQALYHFTDIAGLLGILRTEALWATLATCLSDRSEILYARELASSVVERGGDAGDPVFRSLLKVPPQSEVPLFADYPSYRTYVVSFCPSANEGGHWLHYGRSGTGCALKLSSKGLLETGASLVPVIYERSIQEDIITRLLQAMRVVLDNSTREHPSEDAKLRALVANTSALGLSVLAPVLKSPYFSNEHEWRLIAPEYQRPAANLPQREFRCVNHRIVAFKSIEYDRLPLECIVLGASNPMSEEDPGLSLLLEEMTGGRRVPIERSLVDVRP